MPPCSILLRCFRLGLRASRRSSLPRRLTGNYTSISPPFSQATFRRWSATFPRFSRMPTSGLPRTPFLRAHRPCWPSCHVVARIVLSFHLMSYLTVFARPNPRQRFIYSHDIWRMDYYCRFDLFFWGRWSGFLVVLCHNISYNFSAP